MDPVTAMAIASFAYSVFCSFSKKSSGDPIDAMVAMLVEMNKKLSIINDKLNIIYDTIVQLPDKVEYTRRINDLIAVSGRMPVLYNKLHSDITTYGSDEKGKIEFIKKNEQDINSYLSDLRKSFQVLKKETDALTVSMLCNAAQNDYELSKLIGLSPDDIKIEQTEYLKYLRSSIWSDPVCLDVQIAESLGKINSVIGDSFVTDWRFKVRVSEPIREERALYDNERKLYLHKPKFEPSVLDDVQKSITNALSTLGYFDPAVFANVSKYEPEPIAAVPLGYSQKTYVLKKEIKFSQRDHPRIDNDEYLRNNEIKKYISDRSTVYKTELNTLVGLTSAHNLAVSTVKFISFRVL